MAMRVEHRSQRRRRLRRWLPVLLPAACFLLAGALVLWSVTWLPGGMTLGQEVAQDSYVRSAVIALVLLVAAVWAVRNADRDPQWRRGAWFCSVLTAMFLLV